MHTDSTNELSKASGHGSINSPDYCSQYRASDEIEVQSENHQHFCSTLSEVSLSLGDRITALDLGCGTGRYFHCLQNVETLIGIDISFEMLRHAHCPVRKEAIKVHRINLICANLLDIHISAQFDLIYSIGVFGEHVPWDLTICNRLHDALKPGGKVFVTLVDVFSKYSDMTNKRRVAETANLIMPLVFRRKLRERLGTFYMAEREVASILKKSKFRKFDIQRHVSTARLWKGAHYECIAAK